MSVAMRITFVIQDLFGAGAQYVTALLVRGFIAKGYEVDLIVSAVHQRLLRQRKGTPFAVPPQTNWIMLPAEKMRHNIRYLRRYLKTTESKVVIAMSPNCTIALACAVFGIKKAPLLVHVEHGGTLGAKRRGVLRTIQDRFIGCLTFPMYDRVFGVSDGTSRAFRKAYPLYRGPIATVYNPVVDDVFLRKVNACLLPHPWLAEKSCPTFIAAGAHTPWKNHLVLFEAIRRCQSVRKIRLILFGEGPQTPVYQDYVRRYGLQDVIDIAGFTDNLPLQLRHSDGLIIASVVESFSVVLVEALACGKPVISTDCPFGPPEILEHGKYGKLVPVGDAEAMAKAILEVAAGDYPTVPAKVWERFTVDKVVAAYECAFKRSLRPTRLWIYERLTHWLPETRLFALKTRLLRWCGATVGANVRINSSARFSGTGFLEIGDDVWIGPTCHLVSVTGGGHRDWKSC